MDYNLLTPDYLEMITLEGYRFVDNYREISFFYNEDINAANLHTDEAARLMALGNIYKYFHVFNNWMCINIIDYKLKYMENEFIGNSIYSWQFLS